MKKASVIIILIAVVIITVILLKGPSDIHIASEDTVTLITLPSPPKFKTVNNEEDIAPLINYINSLDTTPVISTGKGWWFMIKINDYSVINFVGDVMKINGMSYKVKDKNYASTIKGMYENLDYPEDDWVNKK